MEDIKSKMAGMHMVELPGAVLLALVERTMQKIVEDMRDVKQARKAKVSSNILAEMSMSLNAHYTIGMCLFAEARRIFGEKFIADFCEGKDVIPEAPTVAPPSGSIN